MVVDKRTALNENRERVHMFDGLQSAGTKLI